MKRTVKNSLVALAIMAAPAFAQLHLITGSPNPIEMPGGFESAVFRLADDGSLVRVAEIVSWGVGTDWIIVSQTRRMAVMGVRKRNEPIAVFDFDKAQVVKQCAVDINLSLIHQWIIDSPVRGPVLAQQRKAGHTDEIWGMTLDPAVPCDKSYAIVEPIEMTHLFVEGVAGVADTGGNDTMSAILEAKTGKMRAFFPQGSAYFDQVVPIAALEGMRSPWSHVVVSNPDILAVSIADVGGPGGQRLLVYRKRDSTWIRVPDLSEKFAARGFGTFVAVTAVQSKDARLPESVGRAEWRTERTKTGPNLRLELDDFELAYSGKLFLYDAATGVVRTINTRQADSEVLLVENGSVYYRVSNRLYSAPLIEGGLGPARLLVTDEVVRDTHWAYIRR